MLIRTLLFKEVQQKNLNMGLDFPIQFQNHVETLYSCIARIMLDIMGSKPGQFNSLVQIRPAMDCNVSALLDTLRLHTHLSETILCFLLSLKQMVPTWFRMDWSSIHSLWFLISMWPYFHCFLCSLKEVQQKKLNMGLDFPIQFQNHVETIYIMLDIMGSNPVLVNSMVQVRPALDCNASALLDTLSLHTYEHVSGQMGY